MDNDMSATTERYHGLDLLRAFAMMLGLLMHASLTYDHVDPGLIPDWIKLMNAWIHLWRMPLFFVLAGFFGCMILQRRGAPGFLQDRLLRVGVTLLVFASIYDPLKTLLYNLPNPPLGLQLSHLWFLYYLMGVCAVAAGVAWVMSRSGLIQTAANVLAWPAKKPWSLSLYLIPIITLTPFARPVKGLWAIPPEAFGDFHLLPFLYYSLWFGMGAALYWHRQTLSTLRHRGVIAGSFVLAVLTMSGIIYAQLSPNLFEAQRYNWAIYCSAVSSAAWCLFFIGLCHRLLNKENRAVSWFVELSYPIYLLHLIPSEILGGAFLELGWSAGLAFWPTVLGAFIASVVGYYILIKFTPLDWLLAGPKKAWFRPHWVGLGKPNEAQGLASS
ncbi:MAG: acyltransferase family protein [Halieaceae bacterium]